MTLLKTATLAAALSALAFTGVLRAETVAAPEKPGMTAAERAKAADCTKQANAKKLHGTERLKFREECKKK